MIEAIDRAMAIMQLFLKEERPLSVTYISKTMGLHKSTVSRTLDTLEQRGFVQKEKESGKYWLGLQVYALGMLFREKDSFAKVAYPYAKALALECNEGVHITSFTSHNDAPYPQHIILEKIKSPRTVDLAPPVGAVRPSYCSAAGKCLLAFSPDYLQQYLGCQLQKFTAYTVTDWAQLLQDLECVRYQGYAIENGEVEASMACIAAPIFTGGRISAAISVSGPRERLLGEEKETVIKAVKKTAADITETLTR